MPFNLHPYKVDAVPNDPVHVNSNPPVLTCHLHKPASTAAFKTQLAEARSSLLSWGAAAPSSSLA